MSAAKTLRLATRGSALALAQAGIVARALAATEAGLQVEIVPVRTSGDEQGGSGRVVDDKSRFVKEIEEALLAGEAELAVHSAKDVPAELPDGLAIVGVPKRADARDALCGAGSLADLAEGARVGTSSLRRRSQLLAKRPDVRVEELRGNVDTRLRRLADGRYDALVLAAAGLERLERDDGAPIPSGEIVPAAGQGCLALEARADDGAAATLARRITDAASLVCLTAERALVAGLDATCRTPLGAHAGLSGDELRLVAFVGLPDGSKWIRDEYAGTAADPAELGSDVASRLLSAGAGELLGEAERMSAPR